MLALGDLVSAHDGQSFRHLHAEYSGFDIERGISSVGGLLQSEKICFQAITFSPVISKIEGLAGYRLRLFQSNGLELTQ